MTKQAQLKTEIADKEVTALVEIIGPKNLDTKTRSALVSIVTSFLGSLYEREEEAKRQTEAWITNPALKELIETGIKTQEDADFSGKLCRQLAATVEQIGKSWEKETTFFNRFHKALSEWCGSYQKVLNGYISKLKDGVRLWLLREQERVRQAEAAANAKVEQQFGESGVEDVPPVLLEKPKVEGMSGRPVWRYRITNVTSLIKAVARGKAPQAALQVNDEWLKGDVALNHDRAITSPDGKKYLYDGVEVYQDLQMTRKSI